MTIFRWKKEPPFTGKYVSIRKDTLDTLERTQALLSLESSDVLLPTASERAVL